MLLSVIMLFIQSYIYICATLVPGTVLGAQEEPKKAKSLKTVFSELDGNATSFL